MDKKAKNVVQFPCRGDIERHLLDLLARVRKGEINYLATTAVDYAGVIEQMEVSDSAYSLEA